MKNIELQGGDPRAIETREYIEETKEYVIESRVDGFVEAIDTMAVGEAMCVLGGGRTKAEDRIDHSVGMACDVKVGERVEPGQPLATVYCRTAEQFEAVRQKLTAAYTISENRRPPTPLIIDTI